jgi:cephalosporin hydroxylase
MFYELDIAWRTMRKEGLGSLFQKIGLYISQLAAAAGFMVRRSPHAHSSDDAVEQGWNAGRGLIRPLQIKSEILQLARLAQARQPQVVVEIGTASGGTLFIWCATVHPTARIISIDLPGGVHGGGFPYWKTFLYRRFAKPGQSLSLLRGNSHAPAMLAQLKEVLFGAPIDFLFIDGDHSYAGVKADFEMYSPLVRQGGVIAFHDICVHPPELDCHVDQLWNELKQSPKYRASEFIENPRQGGYGIGVLEVR